MTNSRKDVKTLADIEEELAPVPTGEKRDAPKALVVDREEEGLYYIRYTAGGEVPDVCKGKFTSLRYANAAIFEATKSKEATA